MAFTIAISKERTHLKNNIWQKTFIVFFLINWINSYVGNTDTANWILENTLVFIFLGFLIFTYKKFIFSDLSYLLICIYLCLHVYGSKYTYAENPFGYWLKDAFDLSRNHYDRIVHFSFGFLLAYPMREMFLKWLKFPSWVAWTLPIEITLLQVTATALMEWKKMMR